MPNVVQATKTQPSSYSFAKIFYPITNRNRNLFLPAQIQPSPVEMEHVSTSLDIATNPDSTVHITLLDHQIAI